MSASLDAMRTQLSASLSSTSPGLSSADALCATCVALFGIDGAAVSLIVDGSSSGTFGASSASSRRLDEYQFTYGEGPCLDAVSRREAVLVPDLDASAERRWPAFRSAALADGIRGVFAVPILVTSECVGALDLFRHRPGPLHEDMLAGAWLAAELATAPLLDLIAGSEAVESGTEPAPLDDDVLTEIDRVEVYQATGILISALDVGADEALLRLRAHAIATGQTASEVARAITERRLMLERDDRVDPSDPDPHGGPR